MASKKYKSLNDTLTCFRNLGLHQGDSDLFVALLFESTFI